MSTFGTYNGLIEQKLANTSEVFFDVAMKRQAANDTVKEILQQYDVPEMIIRATQTFTSGMGIKPTDYFRMVKLWSTDSSGIEVNEYEFVPTEDFDNLALTDSFWWTEDYIASVAANRIIIRPNTVTSLNIRYIKIPTDMSTDSIDSGLSSNWDECIALGSAVKLLQIAKMYKEAQEIERLYTFKKTQIYLAVKNQGGIKQDNRLRSKYERRSLIWR